MFAPEYHPLAPAGFRSVLHLHVNDKTSHDESQFDYGYFLSEFPLPTHREYIAHNNYSIDSDRVEFWVEEVKEAKKEFPYPNTMIYRHIPELRDLHQRLNHCQAPVRDSMKLALRQKKDHQFLLTQFKVCSNMIDFVKEKVSLCSDFVTHVAENIEPLVGALAETRGPATRLKAEIKRLRAQKKLLKTYKVKWTAVYKENIRHRKRITALYRRRVRSLIRRADRLRP